MIRRVRFAATILCFALVAAACTEEGAPAASPSGSAQPRTTVTGSASPAHRGVRAGGPGSAEAVRRALCPVTSGPTGGPVSTEGPTPPAIARVEREVAQVRGLAFSTKVAVDPVTQAQIQQKLQRFFDASTPARFYARRSLAWQTIGVIPAGTSLREQLHRVQTGQVVGFYVPETGQLVYIGTADPNPLEQLTLAHELTHAIDDQHFNLDRVDALGTKCEDEEQMAALGAVEGSAQFFSAKVATTFFSPGELLQLAGEAATQPIPSDVTPFVEKLELWPYQAGLSFVSQLDAAGGTKMVNEALRHLPVSTEQVIHPDRYPSDVPTPVDVPDLGPKLGPGWSDLDVMEVGEAWLQIMLGLRLDGATAGVASTGWGGGVYRAWSNGSHVAVVLQTAWDTREDASQFADGMRQWIASGSGAATVLPTEGTRVRVLFASDLSTLLALRSA